MELQVQVEKSSNILRKLTIRVPAKVVADRFSRGLAEVQRTAKLKGFRPGQAPISIIKQYYGEDVRHRLYHNLVDESFREAVKQEKIPTVGRPQIESPEHQHGTGEHDHSVSEDKDFTFTATVEVMPEIEVKGYAGIALKKDKVEVTAEHVDTAVKGMLDSQAELLPVGGGLVGADGKPTARPAKKGDYVDMTFDGGLVTDAGIERKEGMKGSRLLEIGSEQLIEGFEDQLIGMRGGETKTFRIPFPKDYFEKDLAGKEAEFTVNVSEIKEKKLPELNDEFAKTVGYESVADMKAKATEHLTRERTAESERKLQNELLEAIIEKNPFEVPKSLIEGQTRALAQDLAQNLKQQGMEEAMIQQAIMSEVENLRKRAETQVRASLILESIAKKEGVEVKEEEYDAEIKKMAESMKVDEARVRDYYSAEPGRKEDVLFRLRQDRTVKLLLDKAKIKSS
jgi:trigger factor